DYQQVNRLRLTTTRIHRRYDSKTSPPQVTETYGASARCWKGCNPPDKHAWHRTSMLDTGSERKEPMQKITPFLWFDGNAEEAMNFYVSIFKNSMIGSVRRWGDEGPGPKGAVMSATFHLEGQQFFALNGGPQVKFTPAISFFVECATQEEVDELW